MLSYTDNVIERFISIEPNMMFFIYIIYSHVHGNYSTEVMTLINLKYIIVQVYVGLINVYNHWHYVSFGNHKTYIIDTLLWV